MPWITTTGFSNFVAAKYTKEQHTNANETNENHLTNCNALFEYSGLQMFERGNFTIQLCELLICVDMNDMQSREFIICVRFVSTLNCICVSSVKLNQTSFSLGNTNDLFILTQALSSAVACG